MIGKIIGAYVGGQAAKKTSAIGGPAGAALGVIAPMVLRRISLPAMAAMAAGGYIMKKVLDNGERTLPTKKVDTANGDFPKAAV